MNHFRKYLVFLIFAVLIIMISACSATGDMKKHDPESISSNTMNMHIVPDAKGTSNYVMPKMEASGNLVEKNEKAILDFTNTSDGYIMLRYLGNNNKVKAIISGPSGTGYTYSLSLTGEYDILPLSDGNGSYSVGVYENISGKKYSTAFSFDFDVELKDEFEPFLRPNKYVNFTEDSITVEKAAELTDECVDTVDMIRSIYEFTVRNISYDYELAENVQSGYIPDLDEVLTRKKGICFDYAALMTAMLRSRGIPTKLVVGYTGGLYHAWISTYSEESGWVEASIYFDGSCWKIMDPTFAASGDLEEIMEYIGDGVNYSAKYIY